MEEAGGRGCTEDVAAAAAATAKESRKGAATAESGGEIWPASGTGDRRESHNARHAAELGSGGEAGRRLALACSDSTFTCKVYVVRPRRRIAALLRLTPCFTVTT